MLMASVLVGEEAVCLLSRLPVLMLGGGAVEASKLA
jgi:hypothetical protein